MHSHGLVLIKESPPRIVGLDIAKINIVSDAACIHKLMDISRKLKALWCSKRILRCVYSINCTLLVPIYAQKQIVSNEKGG